MRLTLAYTYTRGMAKQETHTTSRGIRTGREPGRGDGAYHDRISITVRLLPETNERLNAAIQATGKRVQAITEEALNRYFDDLEQEAAQS